MKKCCKPGAVGSSADAIPAAPLHGLTAKQVGGPTSILHEVPRHGFRGLSDAQIRMILAENGVVLGAEHKTVLRVVFHAIEIYFGEAVRRIYAGNAGAPAGADIYLLNSFVSSCRHFSSLTSGLKG